MTSKLQSNITLDEQVRWSVMIPVYNCLPYLKETLTSVLNQDYPASHMQVEVIDDGSSDGDVCALVQEIGRGRIGYHRHEHNLGNVASFNSCVARSKGKFIHILHGDDKIYQGFYRTMENLFLLHPDAGAAFCRFDYINSSGDVLYTQPLEQPVDGLLPSWLYKIGERNRIQYAGMVVKKSVYEEIGPFTPPSYGEDWWMWARIAAKYPVAYTPSVLAAYRKHDTTISARRFKTAAFLDDLSDVMDKIQHLLPAADRDVIQRRSKKFYASYALRQAGDIWHRSGDKEAANTICARALQLHDGLPQRLQWLKLKIKTACNIR